MNHHKSVERSDKGAKLIMDKNEFKLISDYYV